MRPRPGELSATTMIEIADTDQIKPVLDRVMGIDAGEHVFMPGGREFAVPGEFEAGHSDEERGKLSAVRFVRFPFPEGVRAALPDAEVLLVVDHPAEWTRTRLTEEMKAALLRSLRG